jgi:hypothetical protein
MNGSRWREQRTSAAEAGLICSTNGTTEVVPFPIVTPTSRDCVYPLHQKSENYM